MQILCHVFDDALGQRIPLAAIRALAHPARLHGPAGGTNELSMRLGHVFFRNTLAAPQRKSTPAVLTASGQLVRPGARYCVMNTLLFMAGALVLFFYGVAPLMIRSKM